MFLIKLNHFGNMTQLSQDTKTVTYIYFQTQTRQGYSFENSSPIINSIEREAIIRHTSN